MKIDYALSNSFGFGGTNGTLLMKRYESTWNSNLELGTWVRTAARSTTRTKS